MKAGKTLTELAAEIERRAEAKRDYIAPVGKLSMVAGETGTEIVLQNGEQKRFGYNGHAAGQIAEFTGIPKQYFDRMQSEAPELLAANVNRWFAQKSVERRMVRTLDGTLRALMSDSYRPLENEDLAQAVLPVLLDGGMKILSSEITERRLYIKAVDASIERDVPKGYAMGDGSHQIFDTLSPALVVSNSEVGSGRLSVEYGIWTRACTNMAIFGSSFKKAHVGTKADVSEEVYALLSSETKKLSDAAVWAQVRDMVAGAFNAARFEATCAKLAEASGVKIPASQVPEVIERVGKKFSLNLGERKLIVDRMFEDGDLSRYGLHSAITRVSADFEDYDRATELERLGGEIIELPANDFKVLLAA